MRPVLAARTARQSLIRRLPLVAWLQILALRHLRGPVRAARTARRGAAGLVHRLCLARARVDAFFARFRAECDHLSILDGQTLNLSAVLPRPGGGAVGAHIEFVSRGRRVAALPRVVRAPDGRDRVEAALRLRLDQSGDATTVPDDSGRERAADLAEVRLGPGRWRIRLVAVYPEETTRLAPTLPRAAAASRTRPTGRRPACPQTRARFGVVGTATGAAALSVAPPRAAAEVRSVLLRPSQARVTGELLDLPDLRALRADVALRGGGAARTVRPDLQPGPRGVAFTVDLPVADMAGVADSELRWELRFHTRSGATLRAGRPDTDLRSVGSALRIPAQTLLPETGPPVLLRPYYTDTGTLTIALTPLCPGARP